VVRTTAPQLGMELRPDQQQAYQEEQQAWIHSQQINIKLWAAQCQDELTGERAALYAQLTDLDISKAARGQNELRPLTSLMPELGPGLSPLPSTVRGRRVQPLSGLAKTWPQRRHSWTLCSRPPLMWWIGYTAT
jgi:hypothetical protein